MIKEYGFDPKLVEIKDEDYLSGTLPLEVLSKDGQYDDSLVKYEPQARLYETWGCTVWGGQTQAEIFMKTKFGFEPNYNELYNYRLAGVKEGGANPQNFYQSVRDYGLIDQSFIPFPDTYEEFKNTEITPELKEEGQVWLDRYEFYHEWIKSPTKGEIIEYLRYSPIGIGVTAWVKEGEYYVDRGMRNTHWCVAFGYKETDLGIALKIFDSYDKSVKLLHPEHNNSVAKRIYIKKKEPTPVPKKLTSWQLLLRALFERGFKT